MDQILIYSLAISIVFLLYKYAETRMKKVVDEDGNPVVKPLKPVIHDTFVVLMSSAIGLYIYSQFDLKKAAVESPSLLRCSRFRNGWVALGRHGSSGGAPKDSSGKKLTKSTTS